jgi:hypothetical protein
MRLAKPSIFSVLSRRVNLDALNALTKSLGGEAEVDDISDAAIGIDSSVFLGLARLQNSADVIDSLGVVHSGPLILPGQAIQEFWNNQAGTVETFSKRIRNKFETLRGECEKLSSEFSEFHVRFMDILSDFDKDFGQIYTSEALQAAKNALLNIESKALVPFADREKFFRLAAMRKSTKTPPGFKDPGDGDFFIWVDFLTGLMNSGRRKPYGKVVFLTDDVKIDWSRSGVAHPILRAEIMTLFGKPFHVLTLKKLSEILRSRD